MKNLFNIIKNKKGDAGVGWGVIVLLILGLIILVLLIIISAKSKGGFTNMFSTIGEAFG